MIRNRKGRLAFLAAIMLLAGVSAAGCTAQSTTNAQCGFVVGNGKDENRSIHRIIYPDTQSNVSDTEEVQYVPCGPRNYIITPTGDINGKAFGDRHNPILANLKPSKPGTLGTPVKIWLDMEWTLNESDAAMRDFYKLCYKYQCYTTDADKAGDANFSTPGWNGMLGENHSEAINTVGADVAAQYTDAEILFSRDKLAEFADKMAAAFTAEIRKRTGSNQDLFCGSGNSVWLDNDHKNFKCTSVRFDTIRVESVDPQVTEDAVKLAQAQAQKALNEELFNAAKAKYGDETNFWLGLQDTIEKCQASKETTCVINIGGGSVAVPTPAK